MKKKTAKGRKATGRPAARKRARTPAKRRVSPIPRGFRTITPELTVRDAAAAIDFYTRAFGARELMRLAAPDGKIVHAELRIGDSIVFVSDEFPQHGRPAPPTVGGCTGALHVYVRNVDAAVQRAAGAGGQVTMPVADMFWGDRYGKIRDPFGHEWGLATHTVDLTPAQQKKAAEAAVKAMGQHG